MGSPRLMIGERRRGRLKIFFGAAPGVGKTYTMLEAARHAREGGLDVVSRPCRAARAGRYRELVAGASAASLPGDRPGRIERGDLDLDAARRRSPALLIVDELAHSNGLESESAPRHAKRWQDIQELLAARIDVWTTLNVQHLESLNDVVAGITGVRQAETVPDHVFDEADEVELIDLPPTELLARLRAGKIYPAGEAPSRHRAIFPGAEPGRVARAGAASYRRSRGCGGPRL